MLAMRPTALPRQLIPVSAQELSMILTVPPGLTLSAPSQTQAMAEPRPLTLTLTPPRATRPITWSKHLQVVLPYYFLLTYYLTILLTLLADLLSY